MSKSFEDMYEELMAQEALFDDLQDYQFSNLRSQEPAETFSTSEDQVKKKEKEKPKSRFDRPGNIEETFSYHRYTKKKQHKYTETEMKQIRESCKGSIVHDYGTHDMYHQSDEERAENDMLAEISMKLAKIRRTYRKVDQYVEAMRVVVQAWAILEKNNFVHTKKEFYEMVGKGEIVSSRIIMPKLKRMDQYNYDLLVQYISNPDMDASELMPEKEEDDDWYGDNGLYDENTFDGKLFAAFKEEYYSKLTANELEEDHTQAAEDYAYDKMEEMELRRRISPEEADYILSHQDEAPEIEVRDIPKKYLKGYDQRDLLHRHHIKKKFNKKTRYAIKSLHHMLNYMEASSTISDQSGYASDRIINSMFEPQKEEQDIFDQMRYGGSWLDKEAIFLYNFATNEELLKQHPQGEPYLTYGDIQVKNFFRAMEDQGMNTVDIRRKMNMTVDDLKNSEVKRTKKENKKMEAALIQRISKLNDDPKFKKLVKKVEKEADEKLNQ